MIKNEFSRVIEINDSILERKFCQKASEPELKALAIRFDVNSIKNFHIDYIITKKEDILGAYTLIASISAKVIKFIIDGNAEEIEINDSFDVVLLTEDMARNNYEQLRDFDIEIFSENDMKIDVGEIAAQYLSLCIFM